MRVTVRLSTPGPARPRAPGSALRSPARPIGFRIADVRGLDAASAVVAAALAQLGWPYVWGGESRAEGGFDCSGLIDYAFAAAGRPFGASTRQACSDSRSRSPGRGLLPGDLVFVGPPAHHVGLVVAPGLAVEAPHRGALVRVEPLGDGGWTGAGRSCRRGRRAEGAATATSSCPPTCPCRCVPWWRAPRAPSNCRRRCSRRNSRPRADSTPRPLAGRRAGHRAVHAGNLGAGWNPQRERSPFEPGPAIAAQARLMHDLLERSAGDVASALAAYNAGPMVLGRDGRVRHGPTSLG